MSGLGAALVCALVAVTHRPVAALPLTTAPARGAGQDLAVFYSGDGGWVAIDRGVAGGLARAGVPVIGYDSFRYFLHRRTPEAAAADLAGVIRAGLETSHRSRVILVGYSFGANALPAIVPRLPAALRARVRLVALVGLQPWGELQFQPGDWLDIAAPDAFPTAPAVAGLRGMRTVCIYGAADRTSVCPALDAGSARVVRLAGDHHFSGRYATVSDAILQAAR